MATHARVFYYAQKIGVSIEFTRYQSWLASHPDHKAPNVLPSEYTARSPQPEPAAPALDWQKAAPKADLYVEKKTASAQGGAGSEDQPSYPMAFAEMIKLLQEGKPVPGIRQIPNTIVRDPVSRNIAFHQTSSATDSPVVSKAGWLKNCSSETLGETQRSPDLRSRHQQSARY